MATANQTYHLILADIAMAGAIDALAPETKIVAPGAPGALRDAWLAQALDANLKKRVTAMANAGLGALQQAEPEQLARLAERYGAPLTPELAATIVEHFTAKREAILTYNR